MSEVPADAVVVAMSGGVDSSVAAALLVRQGLRVIGVTLRLWPSRPEDPGARFDRCCSFDDARAVAAHLGIPHYVLDGEAEFERAVIRPFVAGYVRGETPNPCLACNASLKFGWLRARIAAWGAGRIATGHYARVERDPATDRVCLRRGADPHKDQSYFLYDLDQAQLAAALFPVGHLQKTETRRLAAEFGLPVADKPDSQEICFVGGDYRAYLRERAGAEIRPGVIRDIAGQVRGRHAGLADFTVGQRHGLGLGGPRPSYVLGLDADRNEVIVGPEEQLLAAEAEVEDLNLIAVAALDGPTPALVKIRYAQDPVPATLFPGGTALRVRFVQPQRAVAPGQALVFYAAADPTFVLGGGTIRRAKTPE